jgi:hypothetical protein
MKTLTEEASIAMRNAVRAGVIDTVLQPFGDPMIAALLNWVDSPQATDPQNPHTAELWQSPQSQRWQESVLGVVEQPDTENWFAGEIARFVVPKGHVGFVRVLDQVLNDVQGNYYPSNREYWGSPHFVIADVDDCRWYLTLDYFDGLQPPPYIYASAVPFLSDILPGEPYPDLHEIPGLWYPAHGPRDALKLICPGNRMLRLFFYTPPTTVYRWQALGRLAGYVQSTYNRDAETNARIC